jgi:hypothetical protein
MMHAAEQFIKTNLQERDLLAMPAPVGSRPRMIV